MRQLAPSARASGALGRRHANVSESVISRDRVVRARVLGAALQREDALPRSRNEALGVEHGSDLRLALEALQPGARQHERVELAVGELAQAGIDVPAYRHDLEILARRAQLRSAPKLLELATRAPALSASSPSAPHSTSCSRGPRRCPEQFQAVGQLARDVLGGVHGEVDVPV